MALKSCLRKGQPLTRFLYNRAPAIETTKDAISKGQGPSRLNHFQEIDNFFKDNPSIRQYQNRLPAKIVETKPYNNPKYLYLINPRIAEDIAKHVLENTKGKNPILAESNPGIGLISQSLIKLGIPSVRLYELNTQFHAYLQQAFSSKQARLIKSDFFSLWNYAHMDSGDKGQRIAAMLDGVPRKSWTDDPVITVVGTLTKNTFLKYLVKSIVMQRDLATYGRVDLFLITYEKHWNIFHENGKAVSRGTQKAWAMLINMFFEAELINKYPRSFFLPWEVFSEKKRGMVKSDPDHLYFIKVTMKKKFPLHADHFVPLFCFIMNLYTKGNLSIIPTCEKWVPGCGEHLLVPKLKHDNYCEDLDIFTQFKDLNPDQILGVYRELQAHPNFPSSPFMDMIEQQWLKTETIDTALNDSHTKTDVR